MIHTAKGPAPECLVQLAATPGSSWASVHADQKRAIRMALARDQGGLCGYCQRRIRSRSSGHELDHEMRIDHWMPRSRGGEAFQWGNLVGSCLGDDEPILTCDPAKAEARLFLCPIAGRGPDPRLFLRYLADGTVVAEDPRASADIATLNLGAPHLRRGRREALAGLRRVMSKARFSTAALATRLRQLEALQGDRLVEHAFVLAHQLRRWLRKRGIEA